MNEIDAFWKTVPNFIKNCPIASQWVNYKNETYYATLNYERSISSKRAMIDLSYCATKALNNIVEKTVVYNKNKFNINPKRFN